MRVPVKGLFVTINDRLRQIIKSPSFSSVAIFASGSFFVAVLGGVGGLIQARWLEPEVFGEFRKYGILTMYLSLGYSVVHDGLIRQYPYLLGKGDQKAALHVAGIAKWWYSFVTILYVFLFAILSVIALFKADYRGAIGWGAQIPGSIALVYGAYLGVMYRSSINFKRLSYNNIISSVLSVFGLIFVKIWGYWGLAVRFILMQLTSVWINQHYLPVKAKALFDFKALSNLAKISLRFSIPGYLHSSALIASMNTLILCYCGEAGLGVYALAVMVKGMGMTFSNALNQIFHVKISTKYGETEDVYECLRYTKIPTLLAIALSLVLVVGLCVSIGPFIRMVLPKYIDSIPVIQILSIAIFLQAASLPLIVINSALWYKTFAVKCAGNFCVTIIAVILLPKTPCMVAIASILGIIAEMGIGYFSIAWNYRFIKIAH